MKSSATPRPDILLSVAQDRPDLAAAFIALLVLPIFSVNVYTGTVPKVLRRNKVERLYKPRYGAFVRGQVTVEDAGTFTCEETGFEEPYDQRDIASLGDEARTQYVLGQKALQTLLLAHEYAVASTLFSTSTFGSGYNTAGTAAWDNASGVPLDDVEGAKHAVLKRTGLMPNTLVIGAGAYLALCKNAQVQSAIRAIYGYTDANVGITKAVKPEILATAFGLERVLIGNAYYNSADDGQTAVQTPCWADAYALVCWTPPAGDDILSPGLGRTFMFDRRESFGDAAEVDELFGSMVLEEYADTGANCGVIRSRADLDPLLLNKEAAHLLTGL